MSRQVSKLIRAREQVIDSARRWGSAPIDDKIAIAAGELALACALANLEAVENGRRPRYPQSIFTNPRAKK